MQQITQREQGEYGYDTANVDRNFFGATLVEEPFRPFSLSEVSNAAPRKRGRIFFVANYSRVIFMSRTWSAAHCRHHGDCYGFDTLA